MGLLNIRHKFMIRFCSKIATFTQLIVQNRKIMHPDSPLEGSNLFQFLGKELGQHNKNGRIDLPSNIGEGYFKRIIISGKMNIVKIQFILNSEEIGHRKTMLGYQEYITFSFRNLPSFPDKFPVSSIPYIQVSSSNMELNVNLPAQTQINNIIIGIKIEYLSELINTLEGHTILDVILSSNQPFLYQETISDAIAGIAKEIFDFTSDDILPDLFYKIKSEELIYHFISLLLKRKESENYPINNLDVNTINEIRKTLLADLTTCPSLDILANKANMSESKMSRLFKQIYGQSIYNYHQKIRIIEAANLIKTQKMSVSDAGFQVGFSNLSHFSRVFERYMGVKPKQYSKGI